MAERLEPAARALNEIAAVTDRDHVLDLACGTGNAALIAAARGASVTGLDFEPRLLELAEARGRARGLSAHWVCDDAASPALGQGGFSVVMSAFGVMYVPDQDAAAGALRRLCAPGARVALAAWTPGSFMPAVGSALAPFLPPPPAGAASPSRWGDQAAVAELLERHAIDARETAIESLTLCFGEPDEAVGFLIDTAGHVLSERRRLQEQGRWPELEHELAQLVAARNQGGRSRVKLRCEYLLVLAAARG